MTTPRPGRPLVTDRPTTRSVAQAIGMTHATVTKLRTGGRLPSFPTLWKLIVLFDLDPREAVRAGALGQTIFGAYLRVRVFGDPWPGDEQVVAKLISGDIVQ